MRDPVAKKIQGTKVKKSKKKSPSESDSEDEKEETFIVEAILDKKKEHGVWKYKVKWQDYGEEECTWEPARNLEAVKQLIADFNKKWRKEEGSDNEEEKSGKEKSIKTKTTSERKRSGVSKSPVKKVKTEKDLAGRKEPPAANYGHFEFGDVPEKVSRVFKDGDTIVFTMRWLPRKNGFVPPETQMTSLELRKYNKDLLIDFYEKRLKFKTSSQSKSVTKDSVQKEAPQEEISVSKDQQEPEKSVEENQEENKEKPEEKEVEIEEIKEPKEQNEPEESEEQEENKEEEKENVIQVENEIEEEKPQEIINESEEQDKEEKEGEMEIEERNEEPVQEKEQEVWDRVEIEEERIEIVQEENIVTIETTVSHKVIEKTQEVESNEDESIPRELQIDSPKEINDDGVEFLE